MPVPELFFLIKLHIIKPVTLLKRDRCFTVNFEKLIKALCRTPTVSASNFNSTFLTPGLRKTYIYVFPALLFFVISKALHVPHRV